MRYLTIIIPLGIILFFGYWSVSRRLRLQKNKKYKPYEVHPISKPKEQTKLRRIK